MSLADELLADLEGEDDGEFYQETNGHVQGHSEAEGSEDVPMDEG